MPTEPGQRRARHQVGVFRIGHIQPGEPGQGPDLAQPLGLGVIGQESGQRGGHALGVAAEGEVIGGLGRYRCEEHFPFGYTQIGVGRLVLRAGFQRLAVLADGVEHLILAPLAQGLELGQGPGEVH
jgi:hypothetical protein